MNLLLQSAISDIQNTIKITGSKSETNRLLLLQALFPVISLANTSNSDDSEVMQKALNGNDEIVDIHHAGTAMRFLTAFFAIQENRTVTLTGSPRMKERPIKILVEALRQLGAKIEYVENEGFPPIKITGQKLVNSYVSMPANVSSQYISALLLIAPKLENGIELNLEGAITSVPYIKMTLALLNDLAIKTSFEGNLIKVYPKQEVETKVMTVESDWSSASYFYSIVAMANVGTAIRLSSYKEKSLQGDSSLAIIYKELGVETTFENNSIILKKKAYTSIQNLNWDLNSSPDIAQTIVVTCFGLGIGCHLTGLHTLKIKETDRLEALKTELTKLGANITVTDKCLTLIATNHIRPTIAIATYNDHRMAMAFAPLALKVPIVIDNAEVVSKSYPDFWEDMKKLGFEIVEK
ncbi:3-phosphoshikimate 1-carboxyvinyltransferase [Flavobacterium cellulosilyticum]|uniref:3-phosphoshikimate 1-carboxyvinyltransferase n=1 Tax=Flavobacterium cellulosilyticum TaxID=2541731 RepID=A0A4R5CLA0_9FLAO|nr:3-phosphoshikimate 1-carboxyvinyltransferase [Flavobacterium cellulosilyticum]TDD99163.1 3-phosphoshikimate 1-carboxyvinyltransferase [Flavobacterium cellulosilyticum]